MYCGWGYTEARPRKRTGKWFKDFDIWFTEIRNEDILGCFSVQLCRGGVRTVHQGFSAKTKVRRHEIQVFFRGIQAILRPVHALWALTKYSSNPDSRFPSTLEIFCAVIKSFYENTFCCKNTHGPWKEIICKEPHSGTSPWIFSLCYKVWTSLWWFFGWSSSYSTPISLTIFPHCRFTAWPFDSLPYLRITWKPSSLSTSQQCNVRRGKGLGTESGWGAAAVPPQPAEHPGKTGMVSLAGSAIPEDSGRYAFGNNQQQCCSFPDEVALLGDKIMLSL